VRVDLGSLNPDHVQVELYADGQAGDGPVRHVMTRDEGTAGSTHDFIYTAKLDASRPAGDFTARLVPSFAGASIPLEAPFILWAENIR
jgi:starch phosphorylase